MGKFLTGLLFALCLVAVDAAGGAFGHEATEWIVPASPGIPAETTDGDCARTDTAMEALVAGSAQSRRTNHTLRLHLAEVVELQNEQQASSVFRKKSGQSPLFFLVFPTRHSGDLYARRVQVYSEPQSSGKPSGLHILLRVLRI